MVHCHLPHHMMNSMMDLLSEHPVPTTPLTAKQADEQMETSMTGGTPMRMRASEGSQMIAPDAAKVPGFPQDAFMDMAMDEVAANAPEFIDLPRNWSAGMQGMMTLLRVMPEDRYERYLAAKRNGTAAPMSHQHGQGEAR
jgi:manganese oxidase